MNSQLFITLVNYFNLLVLLNAYSATGSSCCHLTENDDTCWTKCVQGDEAMDARQQYKHLAQLNRVCSGSLTTFWHCINNTYPVMNTARRWEGRVCCNQAWTSSCRNACHRAKSRAHVSDTCPLKSEQSFYVCLKLQEASVKCCGGVTSSNCRSICKAVFLQDSFEITAAQNVSLMQNCPDDVTKCVDEYTQPVQPYNAGINLPCCHEARDETCKQHCIETLSSSQDEQQIMTSLTEHCGLPMMQNLNLWTCFMQKSDDNDLLHDRPNDEPVGTIQVAGMDSAKLHCCSLAATTKCKKLCAKTNGRCFTEHWQQFENECRFNIMEGALTKCLDEVAEPCKLGCSGMNFCSNFNNRPTEMFRSCNKESERIAELTFDRWSMGTINLPLLGEIPVKDIHTCHPDWWKTIACALQIKPCHAKHSITRICYHDCVKVLGECLDRSVLPYGVTHTTLCQKLAPVEGEEENNCIKLGHYLNKIEKSPEHYEVNHPCVPNPCNDSDICEVQRSYCVDTRECLPYTCKPGCKLGEVSQFKAPINSYVSLPLPNALHCHRVCQCAANGALQKCQSLACDRTVDCLMGSSGRIHTHDSLFQLDCNDCICYNGEAICTHHECYSRHVNSNKGYTGLPCNCNTQYIPVCGTNGHTYWNFCLAKCAGLSTSQFKLGECLTLNPCKSDNCNRNEICVPRRQQCLTSNNCPQYQCIPKLGRCNAHQYEPVCDSNEAEHRNPCLLLRSGNQIGYWGHCRTGCNSKSGIVCGMDRNTYTNECQARGHGVLVDYAGDCFVTPALVGKVHEAEYKCEGVICPRLTTDYFCDPIKPLGACCYVCASEIRVLYSKNLISSVIETGLDVVFSLKEITKVLTDQLSTAECEVFSYISIEEDLVLIVSANTDKPTPMQVLTCKLEAEKLKELVHKRASAIRTHSITSPLLTATLREPGIVAHLQSSLIIANSHSSACACQVLSSTYLTFLFIITLSGYLLL